MILTIKITEAINVSNTFEIDVSSSFKNVLNGADFNEQDLR